MFQESQPNGVFANYESFVFRYKREQFYTLYYIGVRVYAVISKHFLQKWTITISFSGKVIFFQILLLHSVILKWLIYTYNLWENKRNKHRNFINFFSNTPFPFPLNSMLVLKDFFFPKFAWFWHWDWGRGVEFVKFVNFCCVPKYFFRDCRLIVRNVLKIGVLFKLLLLESTLFQIQTENSEIIYWKTEVL